MGNFSWFVYLLLRRHDDDAPRSGESPYIMNVASSVDPLPRAGNVEVELATVSRAELSWPSNVVIDSHAIGGRNRP